MNKRQTIQIATAYGMSSVRARIIAPGLAVHRTNLGDWWGPNWVWGITHIPSGTHITRAATQPKAVKIARALATVTDWSKVDKGTMPKNLKRKVVDAIAGVV